MSNEQNKTEMFEITEYKPIKLKEDLNMSWKYRKHTREDYFVIATIDKVNPIGIAYDEQDARLIAAAPDMLSALRAIKARINGVWDDKDLRAFGGLMADHDQDVLDIVHAAIAKAEGQEKP